MESVTRKEVMRVAKDFGAALFESKEHKALKQAEAAFRNNKEARSLLSDYQLRQRVVQMARMRGAGVPEEEMTALNKLEAKVKSDALIKNLIERREKFQEKMRTLNTEISGLLGIDFSANSSTGGCC
ncbi:MAG: YlbF family regulator [Deltaproteobacteria bacterium]|nr:YlbF family regulator [Deltaproteobacteria bacterium]